jgi:hypothetical protein
LDSGMMVDAHAVVGVLAGELLGVIVPAGVPGRHLAGHQPFADRQPDAADPAGH